MLICLNGQFIRNEETPVSLRDGSLLFGDTLFETLKAHGTKILLRKAHLDRLELSAKLLNFPCDRHGLEDVLQAVSEKLTAPVSRIRLTLSRGPFAGLQFPAANNAWQLITAVAYAEPSMATRQAGIACISAPNQRVNPLSHLPQMKRGNYADCLYAANYAREKGAAEALFQDPDGNLLEGSTSNLFAVIEQQLITPPAGGLVLAGIMRRQIIDTSTELGISVREENLPKERLLKAEEAFISNSLIDLLPISSLDGQQLNRGATWSEIMTALMERIGA